MGVPQLLDAEDWRTPDRNSIMTYVSEVRKRAGNLAPLSPTGAETAEDDDRVRPLTPSTPPPPPTMTTSTPQKEPGDVVVVSVATPSTPLTPLTPLTPFPPSTPSSLPDVSPLVATPVYQSYLVEPRVDEALQRENQDLRDQIAERTRMGSRLESRVRELEKTLEAKKEDAEEALSTAKSWKERCEVAQAAANKENEVNRSLASKNQEQEGIIAQLRAQVSGLQKSDGHEDGQKQEANPTLVATLQGKLSALEAEDKLLREKLAAVEEQQQRQELPPPKSPIRGEAPASATKRRRNDYPVKALVVATVAGFVISLMQWIDFFPSLRILPFSFELVRFVGVFPVPLHMSIALFLGGLGAGIAFISDKQRKEDKTHSLLQFGWFGVSRHPFYLGCTLILCGLSFLLNSFFFLVVATSWVAWIHFFVIPEEEEELRVLYGDEWLFYCKHVPKWPLLKAV